MSNQEKKEQENKEQTDQNPYEPKVQFKDFCKKKKEGNKKLSFKRITQLYCLYWAKELIKLDPEVMKWEKEERLGYARHLAKDL